MARQPYRIGAQLAPGDPFWILVREAMHQRARELDVVLVPLESDITSLAPAEQVGLLDELLAQDIDALIVHDLDHALAHLILDAGVPLVAAVELDLIHPAATSPSSLYEVAAIGAQHLAERLGSAGRVLIAGGLCEGFDRGQSRLQACEDVFRRHPGIDVTHTPTPWPYRPALAALTTALGTITVPFDGIFGISDPLALAGRDACRAAGLLAHDALVVGINGDPLALAAIIEGTMAATVETPAAELGRSVVEYALRAAAGEPLPPHFSYQPRLVTPENVAAIAAEKLVTSATLPGRLVGYSREQEAERLRQLETSSAIRDKIGSILDRQQLRRDIAEIIRASYHYDTVHLYLWREAEQVLELDATGAGTDAVRLPLPSAGLLGETLRANQPTFIPDAQRSHRYPADAALPDCRARVILPIRFGQQVLGLLDLQSHRTAQHSHLDLVGLQVLADQLGVGMRNAELYGEALMAQAQAAQASELKSRLLANVSHELRAPLNVIQGYSQAAMTSPSPYGLDLPPELRRDLGRIYQSGVQNGMITGTAPDVFTDHLAKYPEFASKGQLVDIQPFVDQDKVDLSVYLSGLADLWARDGKRFGLPKDWDTIGVVYNKDMLDKAGVTVDELNNATWNPDDGGTFGQIIAKLTLDENGKNATDPAFDKTKVAQYGMIINGAGEGYGQTEWSWLTDTTGWRHIDNLYATAYHYDDPRFIKSIQWIADQMAAGKYMPQELVTSLGGAAAFEAGKGALHANGSWMIGDFAKNAAFPFGFARLPQGPEGRKSMFNGLADSIWVGSKHQPEAWQWVKYAASPACALTVGKAGVVFPAQQAGVEAAVAAFKTAKDLDVSAFTQQALEKDGTFLFPVTDHASEISAIMKPVMESIMLGQAKAADVLPAANQQVNALFQ